MMKRKESKWWAKYKLIFALPVLILGLVAFTNYEMIPNDIGESANTNEFSSSEPQEMVFIPQGSFTLQRSDGVTTKEFNVTIDPFWMKNSEVSVKEYKEFLKSLKKDSSENVYDLALPNESKAPFENYFTSNKYLDFPIVGVNLQQAKNYCNWKTRIENNKLKALGKKPVQNYRIPIDVEWIYASFGGMNPEEIEYPGISGLSEIGSKKPNDWGLWNMFDNVSEWTYTAFDPEKYMTVLLNSPVSFHEKIIVLGNNFKNSMEGEKTILYGAENYEYVGFRYVRSYRSNE